MVVLDAGCGTFYTRCCGLLFVARPSTHWYELSGEILPVDRCGGCGSKLPCEFPDTTRCPKCGDYMYNHKDGSHAR